MICPSDFTSDSCGAFLDERPYNEGLFFVTQMVAVCEDDNSVTGVLAYMDTQMQNDIFPSMHNSLALELAAVGG